jgi:transposase
LHVVAVLLDRLKATIMAWLRALPASVCTSITTVCTDMWEGYVTAVEEALPDAVIVIDRFYVARHYRDRVLKRRCYGLGNIGRLFQRLTLDVDGYRRFSPWRDTPRSRVVYGNS